jgi:hypothetical protein
VKGHDFSRAEKAAPSGASLLPQAVVGASHRASYSANGAETSSRSKERLHPASYSLLPVPYSLSLSGFLAK